MLKMKKVANENKVKDNKIKALQYQLEHFSKKDTIVIKDTIFREPGFVLDTCIVDKWNRSCLHLSYPGTIALSNEYNKLVDLGLKNSANAKIIERQLDNINYHNKAIVKAEKLLKYMKVINELLGDSVILVSTSAFYELCHKYNLSIGRLQDYTGVVPAANLEELARIKYELSNKYYELRINENIWRVTGVHNYSGYSNELIQKSLDATFSIFKVDIGWEIKDFFKNQSWADHVVFKRTCVDKNCFFIACPKSNLQEKTVIVSHAVDPIIFQYCPYGVLIYTMWGEEAEDKVFEEYKKLNNLV